ncbi:uncharacterized protein YqhQ [Arthrobacter woluwensis]|uniref:hypothetical protein n=1 Tax=Arthrobacter woluwensis TaxID=156980 RepID=UPI0027882439|nr:hypothetical protein [Arthrobacter woluwensis]MDQ0708414.1 uncharacterized protein YqhQ [Arthrobacter woluwensis]
MNRFFRILYFVILAAAVVFAVVRDDLSFWGRCFTVLFPLVAVVTNEIQLWKERKHEAGVAAHARPGLANDLHHAYREER